MTSWPDFPSFTVTFAEQSDFDDMMKIRNSFNIVDISWSERIVNFDDEEERSKFIQVATGVAYGISPKKMVTNED